MKIEQILLQPIGQRFNAGKLSIKTYKKTWQVGKRFWSQVICMDETGEMPVDVFVGETYNPLRGRGNEITAIIATVQNAEYLGKDRKKLVVEQYSMPTTTMDEFYAQEEDWDRIGQDQIKGKIRHGLTCALLTREHPDAVLAMKKSILELQEFIMIGE